MVDTLENDREGGNAAGTAAAGGSLADKTVRGAGWMVTWRFTTRTLGALSTFVLARLLSPMDFGLVALAGAFARAVDAMATLGIQDVMLREKNPDESYYSTGFTLGLVRTGAAAVVIVAAAYPVGRFFGDQRLSVILLILGPLLVIESCENVGTLDFRRYFRFDRDFILFMVPRVAAVVATVGTALVTRSYWALVVGMVVQKTSRVALSYAMHPFRPQLTLVAWRRLLGLSSWIWGASVAGFCRERADSFIIGRLMNTSAVGLFSASLEVALLPISEFVEPVGRALYAGLSAIHHSGRASSDTLAKAMGATLCIVLPAGVGISLVAAPLIRVTLGPAWLGGVPLVAIIGPFAAFSVVTNIGMLGVLAIGNPKITTFTTAAMALLRVPLLIAGVAFGGLQGIAWATGGALALESVIYLAVLGRVTGFRVGALVSESWRSAVATGGMTLLLVHLGLAWNPAPAALPEAFAQLGIAAATGVGAYAALLLALWAIAGCPDGPESLLLRNVGRRLPVLAFGRRAT
ncbi:MAG: oligosaccharide flippase family protein [Alphaproteobacteria bacterium]|nr:oligosaccharide flippase family protein [Alphaproteobacteria bacterium]